MALTQKEIIGREQTNTDSVWLYLEGSFYKAYERSAFAFCTRIKDYRVLRKESKTLGRDILYVGFPLAANHLHLNLNYRKVKIIPVENGIPFLGAVVSPDGRHLSRRSIRRIEHRRMDSYSGYLGHFDTNLDVDVK